MIEKADSKILNSLCKDCKAKIENRLEVYGKVDTSILCPECNKKIFLM